MVASEPFPPLVEAAVGLGSNLGDRLCHLQEARRRIAALPSVRLVACSAVYETEPVDVPAAYRDQAFLNAVLIVETPLPVDDWSRALHGIEDAMLRVRGAERNAPRIIDLDLLTYGRMRLSRTDLTLPHPQCARRRFVCEPFAELRPNLVLPGQTESLSDLVRALPPSPVVLRLRELW